MSKILNSSPKLPSNYKKNQYFFPGSPPGLPLLKILARVWDFSLVYNVEKTQNIAQTECLNGKLAQERWYEACLQIAWNVIKNMFDNPYRLIMSILKTKYFGISLRSANSRVLPVNWQQNSTASLENSTNGACAFFNCAGVITYQE